MNERNTLSQSPKLTSALRVKESPFGKELDKNYFGLLSVSSNAVLGNSEYVIIFTSGFTFRHKTFLFNKNNFYHLVGYYTARKTIKRNWINDKDEYMKPQTTNPLYEQFCYDSLVYALFNNSSQQSSLRQVLYKKELWDIKNEFFWLSKKQMIELAEKVDYQTLIDDAEKSEERFVYKELFVDGVYEKLSPDAKAILDWAIVLLNKSMAERKELSIEHPEYHLDSWDAGYAQLKLIWKKYFAEEFKQFRKAYMEFEDRLRPLVYELGFLKK